MLFSILAIGLVGGLSTYIFFWFMNKISTDQVYVSPLQSGSFYKGFLDNLEVASPRHHDN